MLNKGTVFEQIQFQFLIKGEHDTGRTRKVIYPHHPRFVMRSSWDHQRDKGLDEKNKTPLLDLMNLPEAIGNDTMHTTYSGIFKYMFQEMYSHECNMQVYMIQTYFNHSDFKDTISIT